MKKVRLSCLIWFAYRFIFLGIFFSPLIVVAQDTQMYQVKTFNQDLEPYINISVSVNGSEYIDMGSKGVGFIRLNAGVTVESVSVNDNQLEAASWNLSKGTLEIIVRKKNYREVKVVVLNENSEPQKGQNLIFNGRKTITAKTNESGEVVFPLALEEKIISGSQFVIQGYNIVNLQKSGNDIFLKISPIHVAPIAKTEPQSPQKPKELEPEEVNEQYFNDFDLSKLDSIESLTVFYAIFKNYQIDDLDKGVQGRVDAKFEELVGKLQDSLRSSSISYVTNINDSTFIEDDLQNLLQHAQDEKVLLLTQEAQFEEKVKVVGDKLEVGFENLSSEARSSLLADLNMLERLLAENESRFYRNQNNFRQMITNLKDRFFNLEDLENRLTESEMQRLEEQRQFRQRLFAISGVVLLFAIMIVLLIYFSNKLKKQKRKLEMANNEVKRINENLETIVYERTRQLEETNKELDTVLYRASHDLRSPVCSIIGLANIAATLSNGENHDLFEKMVQTTKDMDKLLKKLSIISEINQPGEIQPIHLAELINKIKSSFSSLINDHKINFVVKCPEDLVIQSNPNLVEVILTNLIDNALFYCIIKDSKDYKVVLSTEIKEGHLKLVMFDNGVGVERTISDRLFDMFFRGNENSKGNGLGLYIVQKSVHALNGEVFFESEPGQFSKFIVQLPLEAESAIPAVTEKGKDEAVEEEPALEKA